MIKRCLLSTAAVVASLGITWGQSSTDILRYSNYNYGFGTARSAAMGGAFASLGADMSAAVINPAGLGMYRKSEIMFSPSVTMGTMDITNHDQLGTFNSGMNKTKFALNNIGFAANLYNGSGALTSFTFGFSYTKLTDFNNRSRVVGSQNKHSMVDMFLEQLGTSGIKPENITNSFNGNTVPIWGAMMAYETDLIKADNGVYNIDGLLGPAGVATLNSTLRKNTSGSIGQYDISGGFNISNILYLGFGFGIQSNSYKEDAHYNETPQYSVGQVYDLNNFNYIQSLRQSSSAWNFKFGAILRPVEGLRIAAAIHTPTYITMEETYYADMNSHYNGYSSVSSETPYFETSYNMQTPTRFIGGLSYTFGQVGVLSVDYERVWYNNMKMYWDSWGEQDMAVSDEVDALYAPANNLRVGAEVLVAPNVFVRAGYANYGTMYKGDLADFGKTYNVSGGFGYRTKSFGLDFAYVYMNTKGIPSRVFSYTDPNDASYVVRSGLFETKDLRHNVTVTASFRF